MDENRAYRAADIRAAERPLLDAGVPLMARAAAGLARELRAFDGPLLVLVGSGNNGGDALFAAAELAAEGREVRIVPVSDRVHAEALAAATAAGASTHDPADAVDLARGSLVVDGILGIGSAGRAALRGRAREVVEALRPLAPTTVAVDLPSGVDPDTGEVPDPAVLRADVTVTFGAMKAGLRREPGASYAGRVVLVDIGLDLSPFTPVPPA
ncbi:NAD(P)H-hydrate epimerase [Pseudolysinimonas sp.]|uniref:NAD(P)H-hydrate epimerase n=1 Tax=Pseudolysinimonas sp. TaxID=2680009 RepID=UPI003F8004C1